MFQIPGFKMTKPLGKGRTIQNIYAFQCLLNIFNKINIIRTSILLSLSLSLCLRLVQTNELSSIILNKIRNIYIKDECNYYILESNSVILYSQDDCSIKIHKKPHEILSTLITYNYK
jgi:hypothetical protein